MVGLKPSYGLLSRYGRVPLTESALNGFLHAGGELFPLQTAWIASVYSQKMWSLLNLFSVRSDRESGSRTLLMTKPRFPEHLRSSRPDCSNPGTSRDGFEIGPLGFGLGKSHGTADRCSIRSFSQSPQPSPTHMAQVGLLPGGITPKHHQPSAHFTDRPKGKRSFNNTGIPAFNPICPEYLLRHRECGGQQQPCEIRWRPVRSVSRRASNNPSTEPCIAPRSPRRNTPRF